MLCPQVWNFDPPPSSTRHVLLTKDKELRDIVNNQYFNHLVSLTITDTMRIPTNLRSLLSDDSEFYHVSNLLPFVLVEFEFIDLFVRKGQLTLLSVGTNLDEDDCIAITPDGKFVMSLRRQTFQELGIEGRPSRFTFKEAEKYVVTINLKEGCFQPGKKNYERNLERLRSNTDLCFDVILAWEPHEKEICPSSVAAYLSSKSFKVKACPLQLNQRVDYDVSVPHFEDESSGEALNEWLGAFSLGCEIPEKANGYVTTYQTLDDSRQIGQVVSLQGCGLITTKRIKLLIDEIKKYTRGMSSVGWVALHVQGFEDSSVNRGNQEHFYYTSGDYHYTVFFKQEKPIILSVHTSSTRRPKRLTKKKKRKTIMSV